MSNIGQTYKHGAAPQGAHWCRDHKVLSYPYKSGMCSWHRGVDYSRGNTQSAQRAYQRRMNRLRADKIGADIFSADQVIGKTLIAKANVPLKRYAQAGAPVVYTARPGQVVGIVYSWVMDGPTLWWAFYDDKNQPYYAQHKVGIFSVDALQQQGAQTLEDIKEAADAAANPVTTSIMKAVKPITMAIAAYLLIRAFRD